MFDVNSKGRFVTGTAGLDATPIDALSLDSRDWYNASDLPDFVAYPTLAAGQKYVWPSIDQKSATPWRAAGCRIRIVGGNTDAVVRILTVTQAELDAAGMTAAEYLAAKLPKAPGYDVPAKAKWALIGATPPNSFTGLLLESGDLGYFELHWMRGV